MVSLRWAQRWSTRSAGGSTLSNFVRPLWLGANAVSRCVGYARREAPLGYAERGDEIVVEYDEGVLRWLKEIDGFA